MRKIIVILALFNIALFAAADVMAVPLEFDCISLNSPTDCAIGESQLSGELTETGAGGALFTFYNDGIEDVFIDGIYFYGDNFLDEMLSMGSNSSAVNFTEGATPADLPAYGGALSVYYSADADAPSPANGVNDGEWLSFNFSLLDGILFEDLLAGIEESDFGFGLKAQGFTSGGSETFWGGCPDNYCGEGEDEPNPVPEPSVIGLLAIGSIGMSVAARRKIRLNGGKL